MIRAHRDTTQFTLLRGFLASLLGLATLGSAITLTAAPAQAATVVTYGAPAGISASSSYTVDVNGTRTFTHRTPVGRFAAFSFGNGPVRVAVKTDVDIKTIAIRPTSLGIKPVRRSARLVEFDLAKPANLSLEVNGNLTNPLFLFANPLETTVPKAGTAGVRYYAAGNVHNVGDVALKSGETVYVAGGAIVRGRFRIGALKAGTAGATNVKILGRGIVDSSGLSSPGRPVRINASDTVTLDGPVFLGREAWGVVANQSRNVQLRNIKVINWRETSTGTPDGIDIVGSSNVTIDGVFVRSYDDSIAVKTDKFGWSGNVAGVTIKNSVLWNGDAGNAVEIGWETNNGYIKDVVYRNLDIIHKRARTTDTNNRAALAIHIVDGATVSNVLYDDIRIEDCQENFVNFRILKNSSSATKNVGRLSNVVVKGVRVTGGATTLPVIVTGYDSTHFVNGVQFRGLQIAGKLITSSSQIAYNPRIETAYATGVTFASS